MSKRSTAAKWTRRSLLATAGLVGGGLALGITLSPNRLKMMDASVADEDETILNTWVKIDPDDRITVFIPHSEMGQGAGTGLAQMLAEEMEADWNNIAIEQAPVTDRYINSDLGRGYIVGDGAHIPAFMYPMLDFTFLQLARGLVGQMTGGSTAIRLTGQHGMRRAGATAREMLMQAAAEDWDVPVADLIARESVVSHSASGRIARYGELATAAAAFTPNLKPELKASADYRIVGQSKPRLDLPAKVNGSAVFGIDAVVPDMMYGAIALPPVRDARVATVGALPSLKGVDRAINLGDAVVVVANSYWTAQQALNALDVAWEGGQVELSSAVIRETHARDLDEGDIEAMDVEGDFSATQGSRIAAEYHAPYLAHVTMEPMNCTARVTPTEAEIWVGHQNMLNARNKAAALLSLEPEAVTMHPTYLGGGFGRRGDDDFVALTVRAARELGRPLKVIWSREADLTNDSYRPAVLSRMEGVVENGRIAGVRHHYIDATSGMPDSERPFAFQYDVPVRDITRVKCPSPLPVGTWRAVDFTQMGFFNECFMDELAATANADPLAFRLAHTTDPRIRAVLQRAGELAEWGREMPSGSAQGIAMVKSFETVVAQVFEVEIADNRLRIPRVISVVDCGRVINPDAATAQITGSVIFGLSSALAEEITVDGGEIQQRNYPDYDVLRLAGAPQQRVEFISSDKAPGGLGEPGVPPVTPALVNAVARATGDRIRKLPLRRAGLTLA